MLGSPRVGLHFPALWNLKAASSDFLGTHGVREFKKIKVLGLGRPNSRATLTTRHPRTHKRKSSGPLRLYPRRVPVVDQADRPRLGFPSHLLSGL